MHQVVGSALKFLKKLNNGDDLVQAHVVHLEGDGERGGRGGAEAHPGRELELEKHVPG